MVTYSGVALLVGAWIETKLSMKEIFSISVALLVGAWIETAVYQPVDFVKGSRSSWARGLKPTW